MSGNILIVDDTAEQRDILARYLGFVGGRIHEATNGEEALHAAATAPPDLILMDLSMPVMDGWEAIRRLQSDPTTARIPVIALTCHHLDWPRLQEAGFCGYLERPITPFRVLAEVERCVGKLFRDRRSAAASSSRAPGESRRGGRSPGSGDRPERPYHPFAAEPRNGGWQRWDVRQLSTR